MTPRPHRWIGHKYIAITALAMRHRLAEPAEAIGRAAFYAVILLVFSRLWSAVLEQQPLDDFGAAHFTWYLAITEWLVLSVPLLYLSIEREHRDGQLAYQIVRPLCYPAFKVAEGLGDTLVRMTTIAPVGIAMAWAMAGPFPGSVVDLLWVVPLGLLSVGVALVFQVVIGLSAFWLDDARPFYWVWQKCTFVLGGLLLPLEVYPSWLQSIAAWLPFSAMLHGPARLALNFEGGTAAITGVKLVGWLVLAWCLMLLVYRRAVARLELGGG